METKSFDDHDGLIWYNGNLVPWRDVHPHVLTHGLHYASCVFEGERVYDGEVFKLTEHSERLHNSARILDFEIPYSVAEIDAASREVVAVSGIVDGYVRPAAWRGSEMMGVSAQSNRINLAIAVLGEATLSFLGVGVPPTEPSLGTLIRIGNNFLFSGEWWMTIFPGLALVILALAVNLLGDWMRDALNPKLR